MYFLHDSIATDGAVGLGFHSVGGGILAYILAAIIVILVILGIIELIRIPFDVHRHRVKKLEKALKKQQEKERKAEEKAQKEQLKNAEHL